MPTDAWNTYLLSHVNAKPPPKPPDALNRNSTHIDARASAVPLGFKDFSAPFLKYAYPGDEKDKNVIVPYLANLFHVAFSENMCATVWTRQVSC